MHHRQPHAASWSVQVDLSGHLSILGIISLSITFDLGADLGQTARPRRHSVTGTATLTISIGIAFIHIPVSMSVSKTFSGGGSNSSRLHHDQRSTRTSPGSIRHDAAVDGTRPIR